MVRPLSILSFFLCWSVVVGFAPSLSVTTATASRVSALQMSDKTSGDNDEIDTLPLVLKMAGVLAIKTAKDVVNYPPMLLDKAMRESQHSKLPQTSPLVMLVKLIGVLVFKSVHDAVYYPSLWAQRMIECQSLEECELK